jgi:glycosyltransferase involved in cell wall biosynthesis
VHDFLVSYGGAERVLESLIKLYPDAPIYTLLRDEYAMKGRFSGREIRTSFLQKFPRFLRRRYRLFLPFFPVAIEAFDLRDFDLVISSSGAWSKGVVTRLKTRHIAYLHSPMRLLWDANERYLRAVRAGRCARFFGRMILSYLRIWDREAADRPDMLVSNSDYTKRRAEKYYRRDSEVIYPPVCLRFPESRPAKEDFFLVISRLTESKNIESAVEAFNKLGLRLVVVGDGRERKRLEKMAGEHISFSGFVDDVKLADLYARASAVIVPSEEDFGMAAAEAIASGTPVISLARGGALEIVEEGKTGELFRSDAPEVLADAVRRFLENGPARYEAGCRDAAGRFSEERFLSEWRRIIDGAMDKNR